MDERIFALISDLHIGSRFAMWFEKFTRDELQVKRDKLKNSWQNFIDICHKRRVDTVLLAGDILHGQNIRERGKFLITTDLNEQIEMAEMILLPLLKDRVSYWVEGSFYHSSTPGHSPEENLCKRLADKVGKGKTVWEGLFMNGIIEPYGKKLHLSHGESAAFIYRESAIAREILFNKVAGSLKKLPIFDIFVHGHWHWFSYLNQNNVHFIQVPCWTTFEPNRIFMKHYHRFQPDIGGVIMEVSEQVKVEGILYPIDFYYNLNKI